MNEELSDLLDRWPLARVLGLPPKSTVVVVGAYKGITMELIHELYQPKMLVGFEPQLWAVQEAQKRLSYIKNYTLIEGGLGTENAYLLMGEYGTDACSFVNNGPQSRVQEYGRMFEADEALKILNLPKIDLMVMNIEGYEWELLPYLKQTGWLDKINMIAVQFHTGFGNDQHLPEVLDMMEEYGTVIWNTYPAWVMWNKKP